jgi:aminoglycoside phosphotransferase (APT) family kinase protein
MALLQLRVHSHPGTQLASLKARLAANIRQATMLGEMRQNDLLDRLAARPEGDRLCHGDFHPWNILGPLGREVLVDWLDASRGDPAADVCRSYVLISPSSPELASAYVDAYAELSGGSRDRILAWLPFVAAARLAEGVPNEVDGLIEMADSG